MECRKLITGLLQQKTGKRLGNLSEGVAGIKADEFFAGTDGKSLDWQALVDRCGQFVDGPFKPKLKGQGDTSLFDSYTYASRVSRHPRPPPPSGIDVSAVCGRDIPVDTPPKIMDSQQAIFQHW